MAEIKGIVTRITFQNEESGFTVLRLEEEKKQQHTCVGIMPTIECGESIKIRGEWKNDKRFGKQFRVESYELIRPTTIEGIKRLLSSGLISDIGPVRAQKIIDTFGKETLNVLDSNPKKLIMVPGIGKKRMNTIIHAWQKQGQIKDLMLYLHEFGITTQLIHKIYKAYGEKSKGIISANPYQLIDDLWGVGFKKADAIARKLGFDKDSYRRIKAGMIFTLRDASNDGHVYLPRNDLLHKTAALLTIAEEKIIFSLDHAINEKVIIADEDRVYLPIFYYAELDIAEMLHKRITCRKRLCSEYNSAKLDAWLHVYSRQNGWQGDPKQIAAFKDAVQKKIMLLTGGPGTGKTSTLKVIVSFYRSHKIHVSLAAPTGRAAQRMGNISGLRAKTIHRLLEFHPLNKGTRFARNKDNPIATNVLICDEVSMIDIFLMRNLLSAVRNDTTLIFVGDSDQLPSVGAGNILSDMIKSGIMPHTTLTTVFRQAAKSRIVTAAHEIIKGTIPKFLNEKGDNCFFIKKESPQECLNTIIDLVYNRIPARYNINPIKDIQVLSPMHKGMLGTQSINSILQNRLNSSESMINRGETMFRTGDKVMQIRNNYQKGVFNGDIGYVKKIVTNTGCIVDFGDNIITYEIKEMDELEHAYCISVHKSQGCEFNTVIFPVMTQHYIMLQRNLIYTALTRARNLCILVGNVKALYAGVKNDKAFRRYSFLAKRLLNKICLPA